MCLYRMCYENRGGNVFAESEFEAASDPEAIFLARHMSVVPLTSAYAVCREKTQIFRTSDIAGMRTR